jgi:hypothetical protein
VTITSVSRGELEAGTSRTIHSPKTQCFSAREPIEEKKVLVRKCISHINVDRHKPAVTFYVRRIPAATPWLEEALKTHDRTTGVIRSSSSGDSPPTAD